ncbi:hypothetical protein HAZT_HAZT005065 [Hyalella azteca]|uniref:cellulase n=1 Tax=Hyalella azteca TaxID=294128 RepID=A0A6A0H664_HYAAZ|nr:hypothetical protein HAZT_HAZT005065 [Hyalella azteca]
MERRVVFILALLVAGELQGTSRSEAVGYCSEYGGSPYDYRELLCQSLVFYEANRSGKLPSDQRVEWRYDSAVDDGAADGVDLEGGYYDAGDFVKFAFPMGFTMTFLAWGYISYEDGFVQAGQVEYFEKTLRWATDYFLKSHTAPTTIWAQVGDSDLDHTFWDRPENMTMARPSFVLNETNPGRLIGLGEHTRSDPAYAATLLTAAKELFDFANTYRAVYSDNIPEGDAYYTSSGYGDELTWGAIWLYRATGDDSYRALAEQFYVEFNVAYGASFNWDNKKSGCNAVFAELLGGEYLTFLQQNVAEFRNNYVTTPGGLHYFSQWGSLRHALNHAFIAFKAADLGIDVDANVEFAERQVNYALGTNPSDRSYVVGVGKNPPTHCHHRAASCPDIDVPCGWTYFDTPDPNPHILYGALVGGPDEVRLP